MEKPILDGAEITGEPAEWKMLAEFHFDDDGSVVMTDDDGPIVGFHQGHIQVDVIHNASSYFTQSRPRFQSTPAGARNFDRGTGSASRSR
jgi:hypothetical protein